eukprot:1203648-Rhodomonas_salina.1
MASSRSVAHSSAIYTICWIASSAPSIRCWPSIHSQLYFATQNCFLSLARVMHSHVGALIVSLDATTQSSTPNPSPSHPSPHPSTLNS